MQPRNFFTYTPLLPAMCVGTVEERSIVEPVRAVLGNKVRQRHAGVSPGSADKLRSCRRLPAALLHADAAATDRRRPTARQEGQLPAHL